MPDMKKSITFCVFLAAFSASAQIDLADQGGAYTVTASDLAESFVNSGAETAVLTFDCAEATAFSGSIAGDIRVVKSGSAKLTVSSASTYTGGTAINAGEIGVTAAGALGSGTVTIAAAAVISLDAAVTLDNDISIASGTSIANVYFRNTSGTAEYAGDITGAGNVYVGSSGKAGTFRITGDIYAPNGTFGNAKTIMARPTISTGISSPKSSPTIPATSVRSISTRLEIPLRLQV